MIDRFKLHIASKFQNFKEQKLLLAFSGGLDSRVLLDLLCQLEIDFSVAHCNFDLRADASEADALFCARIAKQHQLPFFIKKFDTKSFAEEQKVSTQMAARELRYTWFDELKEQGGFTHLLTAHHLDDQLETFMINMGRGTGLKGLRGITTDKILRPLLIFSKNEIEQYANEQSIEWHEDASNAQDDYLRNHLRHHAILQWKAAQENLLQQVTQTFDHLSLAQEALSVVVDIFKEKHFVQQEDVISIHLDALMELKPLAYYLHALFETYGFNHVADLESLLVAQSGKQLISSSHRLIRNREELLLSPLKIETQGEEFTWRPTQDLTDPIKLTLIDKPLNSANTAVLDKNTLKYPLLLRKFREGDYFYPIGMKGKKKLSKFFKDQKYSTLDKENQWILCSEEQIVWVVGQRVDTRFAATPETLNPLIIRSH
ncbi:tRNA lysidine(34) synthetase TilS [Flavobacteriaceae bacterium]|nr:tRNA lysidine(34) synthetase TilS [Flavobacteriaceae bacterium]